MGEGAAYAELHCHSNFSFLDGASHPDELVEEAGRLGLAALAVTDHDGMYGAVRFAQAARQSGLPTVFGAEVTLGLARSQVGMPDPEGSHLVVLARGPTGYTRLCKALSAAHLLGGQKGRPAIDLQLLAAIGAGADIDLSTVTMSAAPARPEVPTAPEAEARHWVVLTGCRKGTVPAALVSAGPAAARAELARLQALFGRANVVVEIWDHGDALASARNDALAELACRAGADVVATNNVHYHRVDRGRLAGAMAAVRGRRSLDDMDAWLPGAPGAYLRSGAEQARRFARYPGAVSRAGQLGLQCAFDLQLVAPNLPPFPVPAGHNEMSWLRRLAEEGAQKRYGPRHQPSHPGAWQQVDYELAIIEQLGFAGYFLIVWDIVRFCNESGIYCQGRGSAANSAVCYALGVTKADAVRLGLLFERFLSPERDGPPDIDVDIESERREEALQYVYNRYGRDKAAQVANVITYRPRSAVRDMGKALGASQGQVDAWSKQLGPWSPVPGPPTGDARRGETRRGETRRGETRRGETRRGETSGGEARPGPGPTSTGTSAVPEAVLDLAREVQDFPRHLGIHSGGMVLCDRPVAEVCPVEWARMTDRSVLQWDKDDCAAAGLVKFDMLGLGMLSALHMAVDHIKGFYGAAIDLAELPQDPAVYEMLCQADSVGVFQVESRAQMATLPRLQPRTFYDLVIEVALIRPGPIQGRSVHPYLRRRKGTEKITYLHPLLEKSLKKTLGVPLFQEQLMQMAIDVAGFSPAEADQLRQAMGSKRSAQRMARLKDRFYAGMAQRGATGTVADRIWEQMAAFANFGFPESHSVSFAYLVYSSAWLKLHYPAAFLAGLLDCQPMGFWSPQSLVLDARRHGVQVRRPDVNASSDLSLLEPVAPGSPEAAVRLGISYVRTIGPQLAKRIAEGKPYASMEDFGRRSGLNVAQAEALATAGAFECFGLSRRSALWAAGAVAGTGTVLGGLNLGTEAPCLPDMTETERNRADLWATSLSPDSYPTELVREQLTALGVTPAAALASLPDGARVTVGGVVTHRQRPTTAHSVVFVNLEDETGLVNVICPLPIWERHKQLALTSASLMVNGRLEKADGALNILALSLAPLAPFAGAAGLRSRDFH